MGGIMEFLFGSKDKLKKIKTMSGGQENLLEQMLQQLTSGGLGKGYGESTDMWRQMMDPSSQAMQNFTDPYMKQFEQETVPGLAERFAGMGAMGGGLSSSGFGQSLGTAGANLQSQLAQLKSSLGMQASQQLAGQYGQQSQMGMGAQPFAYQQKQGSSGMFAPMLSGAASAFAGPFGGALGQSAGSMFSNLFKQ